MFIIAIMIINKILENRKEKDFKSDMSIEENNGNFNSPNYVYKANIY